MKILVADDDQSMQDMFTMMLTGLGHDVHVARDGVEAMFMFRNVEPAFDFILTDYQMPGKNGVALLMEIRAANPDQKMALMSGDPPRMPKELAGVPVLTKGSIRTSDVSAILETFGGAPDGGLDLD